MAIVRDEVSDRDPYSIPLSDGCRFFESARMIT